MKKQALISLLFLAGGLLLMSSPRAAQLADVTVVDNFVCDSSTYLWLEDSNIKHQ